MTGTLADGWPEHLLDLAAWDALPEDTRGRFELVEGVPQVSPRASLRPSGSSPDSSSRSRRRCLASGRLSPTSRS